MVIISDTVKGPLYKVTGRYYGSTRNFRPIFTSNFYYAMGINLWNGSVWSLQSNGKWKRIKQVSN